MNPAMGDDLENPNSARQLGRLLDEHSDSLALYASQWTRAPEDCVQEAFVALAGQSKPPDNPVAWLFRVVRNLSLNEFRSTHRRRQREKIVAKPIPTTGDPAELSEINEEYARLQGVLKQLATDDRELIVLRIWSGLSWQEIAEVTGTSSSTAQRHYVTAIEKMRIRLETQCLMKPE